MRGYSGDERRDPDDSGLPPPSMLATQFPEAPYPLARESKHANADTGEARMRTTLETINHRIGGRDTNGVSQRTGPVWNPATGEQQADVLLAEPADVDAAVQTARKAFLDWRNASSTRRAQVMFAFRNLVLKHTREPRLHGRLLTGRFLRRPHAVRSRRDKDGYLHRRNLRARALRLAGRHAQRGDRANQCQSVRD